MAEPEWTTTLNYPIGPIHSVRGPIIAVGMHTDIHIGYKHQTSCVQLPLNHSALVVVEFDDNFLKMVANRPEIDKSKDFQRRRKTTVPEPTWRNTKNTNAHTGELSSASREHQHSVRVELLDAYQLIKKPPPICVGTQRLLDIPISLLPSLLPTWMDSSILLGSHMESRYCKSLKEDNTTAGSLQDRIGPSEEQGIEKIGADVCWPVDICLSVPTPLSAYACSR
ncbi:unnamed protein product [Nezara viridula]|uniref:Uncharacterized protein n=1 Tax=Nezara viridula TaxID=85310 RepID=A0A9P0EDI6_NEZVI|nr:unnamed protein product [Nezara viridula]